MLPGMSKALPVAVVGGGRVGLEFSRYLRSIPEARLVGIQTSSATRREEISAQLSVPCYARVEELLSAADKPAMVAVVNANADHAAATLAALQAGCHVFCEKPMAPTLAECQAMVDAARTSGMSLQIGFEYIHGTMTGRLRSLVQEGFFGELTWAHVLDSRGHWASDPPSTPIEKIWKLDRKAGGGIVFHCGIHQLDLLRHYLGPFERVTAYRPPVNALRFYPTDVPDNVTLILEARSGAIANFQIFHNRAPTFYRDHRYQPDWRRIPGHEFSISLVGTAGSCECQIYQEKLALFRFDLEQRDTRLVRVEDFSGQPADKSHHDMTGLLLAYIRSVAAGGGAIDDPAGALETMKLAFAAEKAIAAGGGTVQLADL